MKNIGVLLAVLGAMLLGGGLAYGLSSVSVADGAGCGSAFSKSESYMLTDTGSEACAAERSNRAATAMALIVGGGIGVFIGGMIAAGVANSEKTIRAQSVIDQPQES